jgi:hypothetical protein
MCSTSKLLMWLYFSILDMLHNHTSLRDPGHVTFPGSLGQTWMCYTSRLALWLCLSSLDMLHNHLPITNPGHVAFPASLDRGGCVTHPDYLCGCVSHTRICHITMFPTAKSGHVAYPASLAETWMCNTSRLLVWLCALSLDMPLNHLSLSTHLGLDMSHIRSVMDCSTFIIRNVIDWIGYLSHACIYLAKFVCFAMSC